MNEEAITFTRRPAKLSDTRLVFTIPPEIARLLDKERLYKITLTLAGSLGGSRG